MDDVLQHMDAVGLMEVGLATSYTSLLRLASCSLEMKSSRRIQEPDSNHPRFFPWVENPNLANEMRSSANADDITRILNPVEAEVANIAGSPEVMTDWAMSWALLMLARCSQSEVQALHAPSQVQAPRIRSLELRAKYLR